MNISLGLKRMKWMLMINIQQIEFGVSLPVGAVRKTGILPRASPGLCNFTHSVGEFPLSGTSFLNHA
jgi:hypothetical protein